MAQADAERIARYHQAIDPELAAEILQRIVGATRILGDLPQAGPATEHGARRKWRVARTSYILFYRIERDHVRILRVLHGAQERSGTL
ncbi:type II toxin-antitoxin system RelE/ParE family toxin [Sphingomonas sp. S2-65]|jgi:toxin ParE1/3/4|uniref:type II toxin-antitoxin system RelE/ParE family toxin n=1 Tax=Sphingomonas sp. S2-65 TaxID=2903960 RepID=UPI001F437EB9